MKTDVDIAAEVSPRHISDIANDLGVPPEDLISYGNSMAKVHHRILEKPRQRAGKSKLVLVSAITPTPAGEGKTTTTIGLGQALGRLGESVCLALREPSLGPCMGMKGGATGGGYSQVLPADRINLHFTGDFHAITSANNLLSAALDNHLYFGKKPRLDPRRVLWRRVLDMNDRSLRHLVMGLGGRTQGMPREGGFDITAASEVMAMLCLAENFEDLRERINRTLVGFSYEGEPVLAESLEVTGAMLALLRDALHPNLVQTLEGVPALIHGGPFANIAHGCNSVLATRTAMHLADWAVTEAGFGFDLGAEKFFDIKCRTAGLDPDLVVLVSTLRALKMHGGKDVSQLDAPDTEAVSSGLPNLEKHVENVRHFGMEPVVALNRFAGDQEEEIEVVRACCENLGVRFAVSDHYARGGEGAEDLAKALIEAAADDRSPWAPLYDLADSVPDKILKVAQKVYGARDVEYTKKAEKDLMEIKNLGYEGLPICIAKAPSSLSDDPSLRGRPHDFEVTVREIQVCAGAGFLVVLTGLILRMPGLPREPMATGIDLLEDGTVIGLS